MYGTKGSIPPTFYAYIENVIQPDPPKPRKRKIDADFPEQIEYEEKLENGQLLKEFEQREKALQIRLRDRRSAKVSFMIFEYILQHVFNFLSRLPKSLLVKWFLTKENT